MGKHATWCTSAEAELELEALRRVVLQQTTNVPRDVIAA